MNMLLGIGNPDRGDDGIGCYIAEQCSSEGWLACNCGTAPENFTGLVRREAPDRLVLVDAADMGLEPGSLRFVDRSQIRDHGFGTHMLPLYHLINFLDEVVSDIRFYAIQPVSMPLGGGISPEAREAADRFLSLLADGRLGTIPAWNES